MDKNLNSELPVEELAVDIQETEATEQKENTANTNTNTVTSLEDENTPSIEEEVLETVDAQETEVAEQKEITADVVADVVADVATVTNPEDENTPSIEEKVLETVDAQKTEVAEQKEITADVTAVTNPKKENAPSTKEEVLEKLKKISLRTEVPPRAQTEGLKQLYYKIRATEIEAEKSRFLAADVANNEVDFEPAHDPGEDVLKTYLDEIKEKRAKQIADENKIREANYKKKLVIIEEIKGLTESTEDFNKLFNQFKDLQQQWNEIRLIPQSKERELWAAYQMQTELFYDLVKINNELRDYDFKKNLEKKTKICEAAEKLKEESDSVSAFHQLQNYHKQWREIGPVDREFREQLWGRFKDASAEINKTYQSHFEGLKEQEDENLEKKTAIIEKLKTIEISKLTTFKDWNKRTREVIDLQTEWKTIGFVPRKVNTQIFEEFRGICDNFFAQKSEYFKESRGEMDDNLKKKQLLVDKVNEYKTSTDWRKTTELMIGVQKEWKTIGPVPRKNSDAIWKEFVGACDYFFEQKKENESHAKEAEIENLTAKTAIVEKLNAIDVSLSAQDAIKQVRELADEWNAIGFVPFREKDKSYKEFHKAVDTHYERLKIDRSERRMDAFISNVEGMSQHDNPKRVLYKERDNLMYRYNKMKSDLQTYENNMSFLSVSSKGANALLKDVNAKIEGLKTEMDLLSQKINAIDGKLQEIG